MAGIGPTQATTYMNLPVFNAMFPKEGPKVVPVNLDFSLQQSYNVDLTILQERGFIQTIQSIFVDNSLNNTALTVIPNVSNQNVKCPGLSQGCFPIFTNQAIFTISCTGGQRATVFFTNIPLSNAVWSAQQAFLFDGSGNLLVSDALLDGTITGGQVNVLMNGTGNNNVSKPYFVGDELFTGSTTTSAAQTITTGNPSFFVTDIFVGVSADASLAAAAEYTVTVKDDVTTIMQSIASLPNAAGTGLAPIALISMSGLQYNSKGSAKNLTVQGSANLTSGKLFWNVCGGLCTNIGP